MRLMDISSDWFTLLCIVLFDGSPLIWSVLVLSMAATVGIQGTRLKAPHYIISDNNVRWSKIFWAYNRPISRKQTCLSHVYVLSSCTKIGSSSVDNNLAGYLEKTAPLTAFNQVDIVYLYIGQHNNICFFTAFRRKGIIPPTFCKHADFSEEVARRILNSEFVTVPFLIQKGLWKGSIHIYQFWHLYSWEYWYGAQEVGLSSTQQVHMYS